MKALKIFLIVLMIFFTFWAWVFLRARFYVIGSAFVLADLGVFVEIRALKKLERLDKYNGR